MKDRQNNSSGGVVWRKNKRGKIEILLLHRFESKRWKFDSWHLPKGTIEKGETKKKTAEREILEETGFKIQIENYLGYLKSTWNQEGQIIYKTTYYFSCQPIKKIGPVGPEHDEVKWVELNQAIKKVSQFPIFEKEEIILKKFKQEFFS